MAEGEMSGVSETVCAFCNARPATLHFGDLLSLTHGGGVNCCALCATEMQLEHAVERAGTIPALLAEVERLRRELAADALAVGDLGQFGHHPDALIDAEVEVGRLQGLLAEAHAGLLRALDYRAGTSDGRAIKHDVRDALRRTGFVGAMGVSQSRDF